MDLDAMPLDGFLARETVRQLSRRSDARGLLQLTVHASLLAVTTLLIAVSHGQPWLPAALLAQGVVISFLFCALHESIHRSAFATRRVNDAVAWLCGVLLLLPPEYFRCFHFAHHRFTQDPRRDPELALPGASTLGGYLWRMSGLPYWQERLAVTLRHALSGRVTETFVPAEKRAVIVREARLLWGCYLAVLAASLYFSSSAALLYWVVPAILGQPFLRLFLLAEHSGCALNGDMLVNTRTTYSNAAVRLLTWRMPYHAEHHLLPSVPFHALARVSALLGNRTRTSASGYLAVHRSLLRQFRVARAAARRPAR